VVCFQSIQLLLQLLTPAGQLLHSTYTA
jgi:hypothetical protein